MRKRFQPDRAVRDVPRQDPRRMPKRQGVPQPHNEALPAAFSNLSARIWDLQQVQTYVVETVEEVLAQRNVPAHRVCSPSLEITIPAIEAMRYSPLRREIAALIASTMDRENADQAHPSFLNILRQLTEDEIRILAAFPSGGRLLPLGNLWRNHADGSTESVHRNIVPASLANLCKSSKRIPQYIDNLCRLQLLHEPSGLKIKDARIYSNLMRQGFVLELLKDKDLRRHSTLEKRTVALSGMGEAFRRACLS